MYLKLEWSQGQDNGRPLAYGIECCNICYGAKPINRMPTSCRHATIHVLSSTRTAKNPSLSTHGLWSTFHGDRSLPYTSDRSSSNTLPFCTRGIFVYAHLPSLTFRGLLYAGTRWPARMINMCKTCSICVTSLSKIGKCSETGC